MPHRLVPTRPDHPWALLGMALMLCVVVTACEDKVVTPTTPTETKTQVLVTTGGGSVQVPPPIPATGGTTSIEGEYQLTMTASPTCSLPAEVKQRTYTATIAETTPGAVTVSLSGAEFVLTEVNEAGFEGVRNGDTVRFVIDNGYGPGYWLGEGIDGTKILTFEGVALATIGDKNIEGTFYGEMRYFVPGQRPLLGDCVAADHRISLTR